MVGHPEQGGPCSLAPVRQRPTLASQGAFRDYGTGCPALGKVPHPGRGQKGKGALFGVCPSPPLKCRGPKLYVESEGEVAKRGVH